MMDLLAESPSRVNLESIVVGISTEGGLPESRGDGFSKEGSLSFLDSFKPEEPEMKTG